MRDYHIFISHSWSHEDQYEKLIELLEDALYFSFKDYSVPRDDPIHDAPTSQKLYEAIKGQMTSASVVLILAGVYASYSKWINKEIEIAKNEFETPKKILAIKPWGSQRTSEFVRKNADQIVGWNGQSIANAVKELA